MPNLKRIRTQTDSWQSLTLWMRKSQIYQDCPCTQLLIGLAWQARNLLRVHGWHRVWMSRVGNCVPLIPLSWCSKFLCRPRCWVAWRSLEAELCVLLLRRFSFLCCRLARTELVLRLDPSGFLLYLLGGILRTFLCCEISVCICDDRIAISQRSHRNNSNAFLNHSPDT